ncbi:MAG TPA: hypothetical protein DDZ88_19805 [Verrucomicrobiales bacterium]|nr:hypothetical protein [Verrucomicrobiales bacterium]
MGAVEAESQGRRINVFDEKAAVRPLPLPSFWHGCFNRMIWGEGWGEGTATTAAKPSEPLTYPLPA